MSVVSWYFLLIMITKVGVEVANVFFITNLTTLATSIKIH